MRTFFYSHGVEKLSVVLMKLRSLSSAWVSRDSGSQGMTIPGTESTHHTPGESVQPNRLPRKSLISGNIFFVFLRRESERPLRVVTEWPYFLLLLLGGENISTEVFGAQPLASIEMRHK